MAVQWGVTRFGSATYGIVTDVETEVTSEIETYEDADGDTAGYNDYNAQEKITLKLTYDSTMTPPATGVEVTIDGHKYVIDSVKEVETQKGYRTVEISGKRWIANTIPA